jgi:hypothetical protein
MDQTTQLRQLIRESIQEYIREIDEAGNRAALEAKMTKTQEAIDTRKKKLNMEGLDEAYHDMMDKGKMKEMTSEIKMLEKSLAKYGKMLEKMDNKNTPKMEEMEDKDVEEEVIDEVNMDGDSPQLEAETEQVYEMLLMQKRAGIISEAEYKAKIEEVSSSKKVQMLLNRLASLIPGQEGEFLEFMAKTTNSGMDYDGVDTSELAKGFIDSEEDENDEEFTSELMNDVLKIYIPAFESGDGIFEAKKMTAAQKEKKEDIVKGMKKSKSFGKSKDEKSKMYATATKLATKKK